MRSLTETREDSEAEIYEMIKDVLSRVGDELNMESKKRQGTEQSILILIEGMCEKVGTNRTSRHKKP